LQSEHCCALRKLLIFKIKAFGCLLKLEDQTEQKAISNTANFQRSVNAVDFIDIT